MHFKKHAFILGIIEGLHRRGSWTGKTHVQKALSLLQDRSRLNEPFQFVLYKHGPYSFEVESELEQMQSYGAIRVEPNAEGYGVVLCLDDKADFVRQVAPLSSKEHELIDAVCNFVGRRNVTELESLATASWIRNQEGVTDSAAVVERLNSLKPHISLLQAEQANEEILTWLAHLN